MQCLADSLENGFDIGTQQGAQTGGCGWAEVCDVVNLVLVQADCLDQVDLDLITGGNTPDEIVTGLSGVFGGCQNCWDIVAGVGVVCCQEGVVVVEFTNGHTIGPGCPFW